MSFSSKNDAESFRNFIKIPFLDPKRAKLVQKSYGKFTESTESSKTCPGGPIRTHIWAHKGPYGPQPGPGPNPDWDPNPPGPQQLLERILFSIHLCNNIDVQQYRTDIILYTSLVGCNCSIYGLCLLCWPIEDVILCFAKDLM